VNLRVSNNTLLVKCESIQFKWFIKQRLEGNPLFLSWHDSAWIPHINQNSVLDYFGERSNPFYDRTCNNEILKMQRASLDQLQ